MRCMQLILKFYDAAQAKQASKDEGDPDSLAGSAHRIFNHCLYQNLALIFSHNHEQMKSNPDVFSRVSKLLFQKKFGCLEYSSPFILEELLECAKNADGEFSGQP